MKKLSFKEAFSQATAYGRRLTPRRTNFRPLFHPERVTVLLKRNQMDDTDDHRVHAKFSGRRHTGSRGLLWKVVCGKSVSHGAVVRTWTRRRVQQAITDVLKDRGYDASGLPFAKNAGRYGVTEDLRGTMLITCNEPAMTAKPRELRSDATLLVDGLSSSPWIKQARQIAKEIQGRH